MKLIIIILNDIQYVLFFFRPVMHEDEGYKCSSYQQTFWFFDYLYHVFQTYQFIKVHAICISSKVLPNAMLFLHARLYQNCPIILIFLSLIQFF